MGRHKKLGRPRKRRRDYQREHQTALDGQDRHVGPPKGSQNGLSHGVVAFRNQVKRRSKRGRSLIDRRCAAGKNAVAMREELIADQGGAEHLSVARLALIEMIARDVYFLDESDRRIFKAIYAVNQQVKKMGGKIRDPKLIGTLYGYRQGIARNLTGIYWRSVWIRNCHRRKPWRKF